MNLIEGENAKICSKCDTLKSFIKFHNGKRYKYGYRAQCIDCHNFDYQLRKEFGGVPKILRFRYTTDKFLKEGINGKVCSNCDILKPLKSFSKNKSNADGLSCRCRKCWSNLRKENRQQRNKYNRQWRKQNLKYSRKRDRKYAQNKRKNDKNYKLSQNYSQRIWKVLKGINKSKSTQELLGCSIQELKQHLEKQWDDNMSWNNYQYNGWHVDHEIPCSLFDLTDPKQQAVCFHYSNLQPMWRYKNQSKNNKIPNLFKHINKLKLDTYMKNHYINNVTKPL